jgi:hypothetical protein
MYMYMFYSISFFIQEVRYSFDGLWRIILSHHIFTFIAIVIILTSPWFLRF